MNNVQYSDATHIFYNPETNRMVSIQFSKTVEMFEVQVWHENGRLSRSYMSMVRILEEKENQPWEFLGIL